MSNSQGDTKFFSVRIVSIDYYMAPPIPDIDIAYSSVQGESVKEVPVIRVYGSTPAGQKACIHIHRALPYLYIPCSDIPLQSNLEGNAFESAVARAVEKALKLKGNVGSKRQHVHGCTVVRAKKFYGYHSSEELFLKIYLYYPHDVSRAANLLLGGAVFEKSLQPYESHIPFLLQFLVDYNLYGMGHMHLVKMKFRHPVLDDFPENVAHISPEAVDCRSSESQADATICPSSSSLVWKASTIPSEWMWPFPVEPGCSSDHVIGTVKRQSTCELEGDTSVDDILNQQCKLYTPLSQTCSDVKMVQSLIPIWEEEYERSGVHEEDILHDPGKPLPQDVLRTHLNGAEYDHKLTEICGKAKSSLLATSEEDLACVLPSQRVIEDESVVGIRPQITGEQVLRSSEARSIAQMMVSQDSAYCDAVGALSGEREEVGGMDAPHPIEGLESKVADPEGLALLKWLASSQAAEELNSDDELQRDVILTPLLPASTIDKVLEKANVEFENESQQECQDILDSMEDLLDSDDQKGKAFSICQDKPSRALVDMIIPQSDGAGDEQPLTSAADSSDIRMDGKLGTSTCHTLPRGSSSFDNKRKRDKLQWGSLPFPEIQQIRDDSFSRSGILNESDKCNNLTKDDKPVRSAAICEAHKCSGPSPETVDHRGCNLIESRTSLTCSVRDLMRKKRCIRAESSNRGRIEVEEGSKKEKNAFVPKRLEFHMEKLEDPDTQLSEVSASGCIQLEKERDLCESRQPASACSPRRTAQQEFVDSPIIHEGKELDSRSFSNRSGWLADKSCLKTSDDNDIFVDAKLGQSVASCSSGYSSCEEKGNICFKDESVVKCGNSSGICRTLLPDVVPHDMVEIGCSAALGFDKLGIVEQCASRVMELESAYDCMEEKGASGYVSMTFHKKPPIVNWRNVPVSNQPSFEDGSDDEEASVQDEDPEGAIPFFPGHDEEESKQTYRCDGFPRDSSMGIPIYYQNDGSCAYLLTPAISPPCTDSVLKWLAFKEKAYASETALPESSHGSLEPIKNRLDQESSRNVGIEVGPVSEGPAAGQIEGSPIGAKEVTKFSQDMSQISGPSGQSKNTPISQIGFRDPASIGAGQQLTLLSIEVQAESRGDLRPDPQHDAINIIVLAFQNDNNSSVDIHVLLRGAMEACGRNLDGVYGCNVLVFPQERELLEQFIQILRSVDPDILMGWDVQGSSLGFLAERAALLGVSLLNKISRTPSETKIVESDSDDLKKGITDAVSYDSLVSDTIHDSTVIEDEWGRTHASGVHVGGRIVLNVWRLMRGEVKLNMYTVEAVAEAVLRRKIPSVHWKMLNKWFSSGPVRARFRCIEYLVKREKLNLEIVNQLDMINRTSELARVFGIDFFSVLSRGSQYRVESMLVRLAHTQNYVLISPGHQQVASQPAMECLPLVMEPESGFYSDPVVVLDFQSLYPSMIIAYNLCFSTCLGSVVPSKVDTLGVSSYTPEMHILRDVNQQLLVTPNGVMYVSSKVRKGVLPLLLEEILSTRIMVKKAMKKLAPSQQILHRIFNARQLALKLIANVTYGYTAAGFSGRMPCAELADSIVQCGRRTLEHAISVVNTHNQWDARVIYGDTDSMFVLLKGRTVEDAFQIGSEIASTITALNPNPVTLKMEKVYQSCFLLTKKRYVGYSYESLNQPKPIFDAKGIETVRRDTCGAVAKMMEKSLKTYFESQDISKVRAYLQRQWSRILSGRVSLQDFVFAKEVRLGTYSTRSSSSLPPAAIVASKAMRADPRAEPRYAERVPYVVVHGEPGARLVDMVVDPQELLAIDSPYRLNDLYYITKQIIPALQRVFGLVGADLSQWFQAMPRPVRDAPTKHQFNAANAVRARIDFYYSSRHCVLCGELFHASNHICDKCAEKGPVAAAAMAGKTSKLEREIQHLVAICRHCGGGDWIVEGGVKCTSLACSVYYERRKVQKELQAFSAFATEAGFYPKCMVEWF